MTDEINTHNMRIEFGKYKGELVTRLPISYLEWIINVGAAYAPIAQAELDRRGIPKDHKKVEISNHAIDRASVRILKIWKGASNSNEGIYSWLTRVSIDALAKLKEPPAEGKFKIEYISMTLVFKTGINYPTLVTVLKKHDN